MCNNTCFNYNNITTRNLNEKDPIQSTSIHSTLHPTKSEESYVHDKQCTLRKYAALLLL